MAEQLRLNLGALRSAIGLNGFISIINKAKDDPSSDWRMLKFEEKLDDTKKGLQVLREQVIGCTLRLSP